LHGSFPQLLTTFGNNFSSLNTFFADSLLQQFKIKSSQSLPGFAAVEAAAED
jgi:hypothetical protein